MDQPAKEKSLYERAGIQDLAEFYGVRYASAELLDANYFHALDRFHIRWARTMWVYDNVRNGSQVLDLGCGAGLLGLLKRKNVTLVAVDLSAACAESATRNGYDSAYTAELTSLPFADHSFDYVVSLDVMGHIEFGQKDAVLAEIKRVLKPDGITLHGIEAMNRDKRKDYDQMTDEELRRFIRIDGHVGMESQANIKTRFSRFFNYVEAEPRFSICQSVEELIKQTDEYGVDLCDRDLLDYLRGLSFDERRAFNMAMGYVFQRISDLQLKLPSSEYIFLKASQQPLDSFYGEHPGREELLPLPLSGANGTIDQTTAAVFDGGWYAAENFPPVGRWMGRRAKIQFAAGTFGKLSLDVVTHIPDVAPRPLNVELFLNGVTLLKFALNTNDWQRIDLKVKDVVRQVVAHYELEIKVDRTWRPRPGSDDREISIAVSNIQIS